MSRTILTLVTLAPLLITACGDDDPATDTSDDLCPLTAPTRLLAAPEGWQPDEYALNASAYAHDDRVVYHFDTSYQDQGDVFVRDLCGGEPERVLDHSLGIRPAMGFDGPAGWVLYGEKDGDYYMVDRLDEPGADTPQPIVGLSPLASKPGDLIAIVHADQGPMFEILRPTTPATKLYGIAGAGARTMEIWTHNAVPGEPAVQIGTDIVNHFSVLERWWFHHDDGRVRLIDIATGADTVVAEHARYATSVRIGEQQFALVQDLGDDHSESVRLVDVEAGTSREVTINDFTQSSFGRDPEHPSAGTWVGVYQDRAAYVLLRGPDGRLREGYDVATLAPIAIPEYDEIYSAHLGAPWLALRLADPTDTVLAAWDPATGEVTEWYRGPEPDFNGMDARWQDDRLVYREPISDEVDRIVALDITTGETTVLIPRVGGYYEYLPDGRVLVEFRRDMADTQLALYDPDTGESTTLLADVKQWQWLADHELIVYPDFVGPEPGLWALPLPPR